MQTPRWLQGKYGGSGRQETNERIIFTSSCVTSIQSWWQRCQAEQERSRRVSSNRGLIETSLVFCFYQNERCRFFKLPSRICALGYNPQMSMTVNNKLGRVMRHLRETIFLPLVLGWDETGTIDWSVVHKDIEIALRNSYVSRYGLLSLAIWAELLSWIGLPSKVSYYRYIHHSQEQ